MHAFPRTTRVGKHIPASARQAPRRSLQERALEKPVPRQFGEPQWRGAVGGGNRVWCRVLQAPFPSSQPHPAGSAACRGDRTPIPEERGGGGRGLPPDKVPFPPASPLESAPPHRQTLYSSAQLASPARAAPCPQCARAGAEWPQGCPPGRCSSAPPGASPARAAAAAARQAPPPCGGRPAHPCPSRGGSGISGCQAAVRRGTAGEGRGPAQASGNPGLPRNAGRGSRGPAPPGGARRWLRSRPMASEDGGGAGQWRVRTAAQRGAAAECKHAGARGPPRAEREPSAGRRAARSLPRPPAAAHRKAPLPLDEP
ncbi:serine/arginine repetitive matrix protein 3-like [Onychomys torridus]|uniref:serine/arginine repetitive matrix protein 3-like n=1 Tax=Onychomys torridus TaxID=38674 RepID=UPI00167F2188|nr:serine/arginine repetitive matrix protein 3-like [Onychomys torridus]